MQIIAKTMEGLEGVLAEEIKALGGTQVELLRRAVRYEGEMDLVYASNYMLRTALRILVPIDHFQVLDDQALYDRVTELPWEDLLGLDQTFAIDAVTSGEFFKHSKYAALKMKDAIVDRFYRLYDKRPNISVTDPDLQLNLHISKRTVTISMDSSGDSLHKRGYRVNSVEAPLNEVLAAGMVLHSEWDGNTPLLDPMCGSGTILIEAARYALGIPPQLADRSFGFLRWANFDEAAWQQVLQSYAPATAGAPIRVEGRDKSMRNMRAAQLNIEEAGLADQIEVTRRDFFKADDQQDNCTIITNPPYDERLREEDIEDFYESMGDVFKRHYAGSTAWVISGNPQAFKYLGLRTSRKITLFNGPILSKLHKYEMYAGSKKHQ